MSTKYRFHYHPVTGEYNDSLIGDYIWTSNNLREAYPDIMTPYSWSRMRNGYKETILLSGYLQVGNICGRIYNNASMHLKAYVDLIRMSTDPSKGVKSQNARQ